MPSTDRRLGLKEKTSMAQTVWQPAVYAKGLREKMGIPETKNNFFIYVPLYYTYTYT